MINVDPSPDLTEACYQALLRHFWWARNENLPREAKLYPYGYLLSYGQLIDAAKVPLDPRNTGGPLYWVAERCVSSGRPPINALVVNKQTGIPDEGFFGAPGSKSRLADVASGYGVWLPIVQNCIASEDYEQPTGS
jgi:hypothetical protein